MKRNPETNTSQELTRLIYKAICWKHEGKMSGMASLSTSPLKNPACVAQPEARKAGFNACVGHPVRRQEERTKTTMTPEKTYQLVCEMLHSYDAVTGNDAAEKVISDTSDFLRCFNPFYESAAALLLDAKTRMDKSSSSASVVSAAKRICKSAADNNRMRLGGLVFQDGYYCLCDGYRILRMKDDITSLPHLDNSPEQPKLADLMREAMNNQTLQIALTDPADVKAYIARIKAKGLSTREVSYQLSDGVYVNPQYLLDMLQALPGCTCYTHADKVGKAILYFLADNGDGVLLPVNPGTAITL